MRLFNKEEYFINPSQNVFLLVHSLDMMDQRVHPVTEIFPEQEKIIFRCPDFCPDNLFLYENPENKRCEIWDQEDNFIGIPFVHPDLEIHYLPLPVCEEGDRAACYLTDGIGVIIYDHEDGVKIQKVMYPLRTSSCRLESPPETYPGKKISLVDLMLNCGKFIEIEEKDLEVKEFTFHDLLRSILIHKEYSRETDSKPKLDTTLPFNVQDYISNPELELYLLANNSGETEGWYIKECEAINEIEIMIRLPENLYFYTGLIRVGNSGQVIGRKGEELGRLVFVKNKTPLEEFCRLLLDMPVGKKLNYTTVHPNGNKLCIKKDRIANKDHLLFFFADGTIMRHINLTEETDDESLALDLFDYFSELDDEKVIYLESLEYEDYKAEPVEP